MYRHNRLHNITKTFGDPAESGLFYYLIFIFIGQAKTNGIGVKTFCLLLLDRHSSVQYTFPFRLATVSTVSRTSAVWMCTKVYKSPIASGKLHRRRVR